MREDEPDEDILGPSVREFWSQCSALQPVTFGFAWITAPLLALATLCVTARHLRSLRTAPLTLFRQTYLRCVGLPLMYAVANLVVVLTTPRGAQLQNFNLSLYQAFVMAGFGDLLLQLLSIETFAIQEDAGASEGRDASDRILSALAAQGPRKHFAKPPCCCFCYCCCRAHDLTSGQLLLCFLLLWQYTLVLPLKAVSGLYIAFVAPEKFRDADIILGGVEKVSSLAAMWGLATLLFATREVLHKWNTRTKMVTLKVVMLIQVLQRPIIDFIVDHIHGPLCLGRPSMVDFWNSWMLLCWSVVLAERCRRAFPAAEVMSEDDELYIPGNINIDLRRHHQRTRAQPRSADRSLATMTDSLVGGASLTEPLPQALI